MLGISIFAVIMTYVTFCIFHAFGKMSKHISSFSGKSEEDAPRLTIEDMYSPNNKLSSFFKMGNSYSILGQITLSTRKKLWLPIIPSI